MIMQSISSDSLVSVPTLHTPSKPNLFPTWIDPRLGNRPTVIAVDTETTGLRWSNKERPFAISLAWYDKNQDLKTGYFDWPVDPLTRQPVYSPNSLNLFNSWYRDHTIRKVFANTKFDMHMIWKNFAVLPKGKIEDVLIAAWCCNTLEKSYRLNDLAEKYLQVDQEDQKILRSRVDKARKLAKKEGLNAGPEISGPYQDYWLLKYYDHNNKDCEIYACKDAGERTLDLWFFYEEALTELEAWDTYNKEMECLHIIFKMEERGVRFHEHECIEQLDILNKVCTEKEKLIKETLCDDNLNINSDKQLIPYIYGHKTKLNEEIPVTSLNLPIIAWTDGGKLGKKQPSMSTETLRKLQNKDVSNRYETDGVVNNLIQYRGYNTGVKYFKNYLQYAVKDSNVGPEDLPFLHQKKAIHPSFNQIAAIGDGQNRTRTGRLSSSDPNLQNVADPEKSNALVDGRASFGPRDGYVWYCIDYSGLELRLFAERSQGRLLDAFLAGRDPHDETRQAVPFLAAMPIGKGRKLAKNTNFTIINCGGANVLEKKYNVPITEGKQIVKEFYKAYPETILRQRAVEQFGIAHGYIETIFGRRINIDLSKEHGKYNLAYRGTSYDIQGSAADIIKRAMIETYNFIKKTKYDAHLVLSIHDELVFEIKKEHCYKKFIKALVFIMENIASDMIKIPLKCEVQKTYTNWSTKEKKEVVL